MELGDVIVKHFLPLYHVFDMPTPRDIQMAKSCWKMVYTSSSPAFAEEKCDSSSPASLYETCFEYYGDVFLHSLFEIDSKLRVALGDEKSHMHWISNLFKTILEYVEDSYEFNRHCQRLIRKYLQMGFTVESFSLVCEMTFFSFGKVLHADYSCDVHMAWVKIFSWMLRIMVPVALSDLLAKNGCDPKDKRIPVYGDWNRIPKQVRNKCDGGKRITKIKKFLRSILSWKSSRIFSITESDTDFSDLDSMNDTEVHDDLDQDDVIN